MEPFDLLRYAAGVIEKMGLRYFVTGSTVTIFYGAPRFTNDIDIVVEIPEQRVIEFCRHFPQSEYYVSETAAREAVVNKTQFNIVRSDSGLKIDVMVPALDAFNASRFLRVRRFHAADDFEPYFASPEDAIIKKMEYYREGGSEKHIRDIAGILQTMGEKIDAEYVAKWADEMGLGDIWSTILKQTSAKQ